MRFLLRLLHAVARWTATHARGLVSTAAFIGLAVGFYLAWPPLGWIVPSGLVISLVLWSRIKGGTGD